MVRRYLSPAEFHYVAAEQPNDLGVRFVSRGEVQRASANSRVVTFTVSTAEVDRVDDTISVDGWELANYERNPVVLWAHNNLGLPIGRSVSVRREAGRLIAAIEFVPPSIYPFAETIFQMVQSGYLTATSVGFQPLEFRYDQVRDGIDYLKQELLEISIVPVPCNPGALQASMMSAEEISAIFDHSQRGSAWPPSPVQNGMYRPPQLFGYEIETRRAIVEQAKASRRDKSADRRRRELSDLKRQIAESERPSRRRQLQALRNAIQG